jgi:pimeloyl-ACP methyl ester carboxylesterase
MLANEAIDDSPTMMGLSVTEAAIILVHGAFHGAWCWEECEGPLTSRGWHVRSVELSLTSLYEDSQIVRNAVAVAKQSVDFVALVGHSYGGVVISDGGHDADRLIYLAGAMPDAGETAAAVFPSFQTPEMANAAGPSEDGLSLDFDQKYGPSAFYNRCSEKQVVRAVDRVRPFGVRCLEQPVHRPAWQDVPTSYVVCTDDRAMSVSYQRKCAEQLADDFTSVDADHSAFYSATYEVIELIDASAGHLVQGVADSHNGSKTGTQANR